MKIEFALKPFFKNPKAKSSQVNHFLLRDAKLEVTLVFEDSTEKVFSPPRNLEGKFVLDLGPNDIPDLPSLAHVGEKKRITRCAMDFWVDFSESGRTFRLLKVRQDFSLRELPTNSDQNIDYALHPFSWTHSATSALRTSNRNVHPLLDVSRLGKNIVEINALVVDVTELWDFLHEKNENYQFYKETSPAEKVRFKVFAHLGGSPFIWYSVVPAYLANSSAVSPHVFYFAGDYGEKQNFPDEEKYLFDNAAQFEARNLSIEEEQERKRRLRRTPRQDEVATSGSFNGNKLLLGYLLPPIDDDKIVGLKPRFMDKGRFESMLETRRNVVGFDRSSEDPRQIALQHWNLGAGIQKAFYGTGKIQPQQFLLLPQVYGTAGQSVKGLENTSHLRNVTGAIVDVLQTQTELIGRQGDRLVAKDKLVLTGYSESGLDLWHSCNANLDHIKAIIGIEPNSVNPRGRDVIPKLLDRKVKVFIIGRHLTHKDKEKWKYHYRPEISDPPLGQITFFPKKTDMLAYPPQAGTNDFVKLRVARVTDPASDPLMLESEKDILDDYAKRPKPIKGKAVLPIIFDKESDKDSRRFGSVIGVMYTHNFALTGGQDLEFLSPPNIYGKDAAVRYRTFFQQAVEEIG